LFRRELNSMEIGLVVDSHLQKAFADIGIISELSIGRIAIEMEAWLALGHRHLQIKTF